jgi:hypothetical protein
LSISSWLDLTRPAGATSALRELEGVEFIFRSIKVEDVADNITVTDNWHEVSAQPEGVG